MTQIVWGIRNPAVPKTLNLFWVAYGSYVLGGFSVHFSGSKAAWTALVFSVVLLAISGYSLLHGFRKGQAQ